MAWFGRIGVAYADAASNTSLTSAFTIPVEMSHFAIGIPTTTVWCATTTCGIQVLGCDSATGTFRQIGYSNNPATATSGFRAWDAGTDCGNTIVICEALQFAPGWAKLKFTNTATVATAFNIYARKFD